MANTINTQDYTKLLNTLTSNTKSGTVGIGSQSNFSTLLNQLSSVGQAQSSQKNIDTGNAALEEAFQKASDTYGVPVNLLKAVGKAESGFRADAVSKCGAVGIMQLMPQTAKGLGVTDSYNAEQNIMGGAKYLKSLLDRYNGDTKLALAAYNAGPGNVAKYGGIPPFKETQNYVSKVLGYAGEDITIPGNLSNALSGAALSQYDSLSGLTGTLNPSLLRGLDASMFSGLFSDQAENASSDLSDLTAIIKNNPELAPYLANLMKMQSLSLLDSDETDV